MYKLLLVTDATDVQNAFEKIQDWSMLGYRAPRVANGAKAALESLSRHHADGLALGLQNREEEQFLLSCLMQQYPQLPIIDAPADEDLIRRNIGELSTVITFIRSDNCDGRYDEADAMAQLRHDFFRALMRGDITDSAVVRRKLRLLRSRMDPDSSCVVVRFSLPADDGYLAGRWHYGSERLEVAMRNLFGRDLEGMRLLISVPRDEEIDLLACPMLGETMRPEDSQTSLVTAHVSQAVEHVHEYLGIDMRVRSVEVLTGVEALASKNTHQ